MEKPAFKSKNRLLTLLPKVASAVTFQIPPFSPSKEKMRSSSETCSTKPKTHLGKGSSGGASGPMTSIIPAEARYKTSTNSSSFAAHEPTSPKVSCMGQIKHKKKMCKYYQDSLPPPMEYLDQVLNFNNNPKVLKSVQSFSEVKKKNPRVLKPVRSFKNMFGKAGGKKSCGVDHDLGVIKAPCLSQKHRFSSCRSSLSSFDWTAAQIAPVESDHDRSINDHAGDEDKICFTAPIQIGGCKAVSLEPRKEINLWKRRTMAQPKPLQLTTLRSIYK